MLPERRINDPRDGLSGVGHLGDGGRRHGSESTGQRRAWAGSGGGISRYVTDPTWQPVAWHWAGNSCGLDCREVPDISANAGVGMVIYSGGAWVVAGGTSLSAPLVAGQVADRNNGCSTATANLAETLYPAQSQGIYGTGLTDITSGNNDLTGTYAGADYPATVGYDPVTGLDHPWRPVSHVRRSPR